MRTALIQPAASCGTFYTGVVYPSSSADYCTVALSATSNRVQSGTPVAIATGDQISLTLEYKTSS